MNKKNLILIAVVILLAIFLGIAVYYYAVVMPAPKVENVNGGLNTQNKETPETEAPIVNPPGIEVQTQPVSGSVGGGLVICVDKCGDGVCQSALETKCDNLNCICKEDKQECPQDCK